MTPEEQFERVLECLNTAYEADFAAIQTLCINRVPCNMTLANHPLIPVDDLPTRPPGSRYTVGALGLINGVLEAAGLPLVGMSFSDEADKYGRHEFLGFCKAERLEQKKETP